MSACILASLLLLALRSLNSGFVACLHFTLLRLTPVVHFYSPSGGCLSTRFVFSAAEGGVLKLPINSIISSCFCSEKPKQPGVLTVVAVLVQESGGAAAAKRVCHMLKLIDDGAMASVVFPLLVSLLGVWFYSGLQVRGPCLYSNSLFCVSLNREFQLQFITACEAVATANAAEATGTVSSDKVAPSPLVGLNDTAYVASSDGQNESSFFQMIAEAADAGELDKQRSPFQPVDARPMFEFDESVLREQIKRGGVADVVQREDVSVRRRIGFLLQSSDSLTVIDGAMRLR